MRLMRLVLMVGIAVVGAIVPNFGDRVLAQDATTDGGDAMSAYVTLDLEAGFPLDPFIVSVNGGGEIDASAVAEGCTGFVNADPTVALTWTGETEFVEAFFYSDHDPVLVVRTPSGEFLCNDDAHELLLDPVVRIDNPEQGQYAIWVGTYAPDQLLPGVLVLTTRPDINLGTFDLGGLIRRAPIPKAVPELREILRGARRFVQGLQALEESGIEVADLKTGLIEAIVQRLTGEGDVPAFELPVEGLVCNGFVEEEPDYVFDWAGDAEVLRIFFEGDGDATLIVQTPDGQFWCNDDAIGLNTLNPLVDIPAPASGQYRVFVGRINPAEPVEGELTVSESTDDVPAALDSGE